MNIKTKHLYKSIIGQYTKELMEERWGFVGVVLVVVVVVVVSILWMFLTLKNAI